MCRRKRLASNFSNSPDVIVLKEILTGMNGSKVAGLLSAMQATREISVILYDSTGQLKDGSLFSQGTASGVHRNVWSINLYTILEAVNEVFAVEEPAQ
jgi:hypothetical protein